MKGKLKKIYLIVLVAKDLIFIYKVMFKKEKIISLFINFWQIKIPNLFKVKIVQI